MQMEALIIKYTLGTCFVAVTLVFGIKILILLATVAKLKLLALFEGQELLMKFVELLSERGGVK